MAAGTASVEAQFRIAADRGLIVDIHCDESDDPLSRHIDDGSGDNTLRHERQHRIARHLDAFDGQLLSLEVHRADCAIRDEYHCQSVLINITLQGGRTRALTGAD